MSNDSEFTPPASSLPAELAAPQRQNAESAPEGGLEPAPKAPSAPAHAEAPDGLDAPRGLRGFDSFRVPDHSGDFPAEPSSDLAPDFSADSSTGSSTGSWVRPTAGFGLEALPPLPSQSPLIAPPPPPTPPKRARQIPNLGHTLLLLILAFLILILTEIGVFVLAMGMHLFGNETPQQLLREPRLLIPCMAISYLITVALAWALFTNLWRLPFLQGIRWNSEIVLRRSYIFLGVGILLSVGVQLLSNYLPIPKTLPIDDFFRTPADLWLVATFGTFLAPVCEELVFRGFLLPSLASAWDWMAQRSDSETRGGVGRNLSQWAMAMQPRNARGLPEQAATDPHWSARALIFSSILTSVGFALLHADQLAHSWAPLAVLFTVSLVLCAVRLIAHSLAASALVHAAYNGTIFALIFYATDGFRHLDKLTR